MCNFCLAEKVEIISADKNRSLNLPSRTNFTFSVLVITKTRCTLHIFHHPILSLSPCIDLTFLVLGERAEMLFFSGSTTEEEHFGSKRLGENIPKLFSVLYSCKWALTLSPNTFIFLCPATVGVLTPSPSRRSGPHTRCIGPVM